MMMFKTGDDIRQDALILQLFKVMDTCLQEVQMNMKFSIYGAVPFTKDDGMC